ncbi:MAG TPA: redoxin family protein, partial [Bryobacteraceae bacterium]|nr:redoxin family protein [Bryobacteraceae bacterium]
AAGAAAEAETRELQSALAETGGNAQEFARVIERHLAKYPNSPQADQLERHLVKAAMEANDHARLIKFGERVLARNPDEPQILERVTRALLATENQAENERALKYALQFEKILLALEKEGPSSQRQRAQLLEELDRAMGRALVFRARATGNLGKIDEAVAVATKAFDRYPTGEAAREIARWHARADRDMDAVRSYADAFAMPDPKNTDADRAKDRARMGELYRKHHNSEAGLGDIILAAYDRTAALAGQRIALQRQRDPNSVQSDPMEFTLSALAGQPLNLASLRGKVIVLDFWATWCGPCRVQHPLYEQVKKGFGGREDVVFLNINTDEDADAVGPFVEQSKWDKSNVYFEDGLGTLLKVSSIPTTIIIDRQGKIFSRMNGFVPDRFVEQLTSQIKEALGKS